MGFGCKTPEQAKLHVKRGETLNLSYYPENQKDVKEFSLKSVFTKSMKRLFDEQNVDDIFFFDKSSAIPFINLEIAYPVYFKLK
jgi:hypothetical protein